jgi:hypothetical protein
LKQNLPYKPYKFPEDQSILGHGPGTVLFSAAMFYIFNDTNGFARVSLHCWKSSRPGAVIVTPDTWPASCIDHCAWDGLDPGLVAASRLADSPMVAAGFGLMAIALLYS